MCSALCDMACQICFLLILAGLTGIDSITTVSKVSAKTGGSISIPCLYPQKYRNNVKYLCKGYYWNSCSYEVQTNRANTSKFSIFDEKDKRIFTVTIKDLKGADTGFYWCAVEINNGGDDGTYFHLSVTSSPSLFVDNQFKVSLGEKITINCSNSNTGQHKWCRLGGPCVSTSSGSINGISVSIHGGSVTMSGLKPENSGWYLCVRGDIQMPVHLTVTKELVTKAPETTNKAVTNAPQSIPVHQSVIITLSVLILLVIVTLLIWFLVKRHEKRQVPSIAETDEGEVTYTVVRHKRKKPSKVEAEDDDVVYSDLSQQRQHL